MYYDVTIIGGGVIGGLIARELSAYNNSVCILEAASDVAMGASKANSGIVHAGYDPVPGSNKAIFNVRGAALMEEVCKDLGVKYRRNGAMVVAYNNEEIKTLEFLLERGKGNGVKELEIIDGDRARELEPHLSEDIAAALHVPTSAVVCPYQLTVAAVGNAMDNGAELKTNFKVSDISKTDKGFLITSDKGETVEASYVINCAGVHAEEIANMVGDHSFELYPSAGEYFLLDKKAGYLTGHTLFAIPGVHGKGVLATKTVDGNILLGPTAIRKEDIDDKGTTDEGLSYVREREQKFFDEVPWNKVITSFSGVRAKCSRKDFVIESPFDGFMNVAGIDSPGLSSAPAIAEYVAKKLSDEGVLSEKKKDFDGHRSSSEDFQKLSLEEKAEFIKENPLYGRVICRCEGVTEGEIVQAIHQNPKPVDVDGIKRRTRAGMGRCQGGFCLTGVLEILERETSQDIEEITKCGGKSNYIFNRIKCDKDE